MCRVQGIYLSSVILIQFWQVASMGSWVLTILFCIHWNTDYLFEVKTFLGVHWRLDWRWAFFEIKTINVTDKSVCGKKHWIRDIKPLLTHRFYFCRHSRMPFIYTQPTSTSRYFSVISPNGKWLVSMLKTHLRCQGTHRNSKLLFLCVMSQTDFSKIFFWVAIVVESLW